MLLRLAFALTTLCAATVAIAIPLERPDIYPRQTTTCAPQQQGILLPSTGSSIEQIDDGSYACTTFEVVYCSGQYFKTRSLNVDLLLSLPGQTSGQALLLDQTPTAGTAEPGYYGYSLNATVCPSGGSYITGQRVLSIYETTTGYYNPNNFVLTSVFVNFTVCD